MIHVPRSRQPRSPVIVRLHTVVIEDPVGLSVVVLNMGLHIIRVCRPVPRVIPCQVMVKFQSSWIFIPLCATMSFPWNSLLLRTISGVPPKRFQHAIRAHLRLNYHTSDPTAENVDGARHWMHLTVGWRKLTGVTFGSGARFPFDTSTTLPASCQLEISPRPPPRPTDVQSTPGRPLQKEKRLLSFSKRTDS